MTPQSDMIIVGAGLSGLLTAWRCLDVNPDLTITIIEAADRIGGDHTWSFNLTDVPDYLRDWIAPFIAYQWPQYEVRFPEYTRTLEIPYCTGNSETLRACVQPLINEGRLKPLLNAAVDSVGMDRVTLASGEILTANVVLDARGFEPSDNVILGYQKFVGHTIRTKVPHGLTHPIIMDATVEQLGGYRFVYCLPFSDTEILVEDTYYTDGASLSENEVTARIDSYIAHQGWDVNAISRREKGVLPITLAIDGFPYPTNAIGIRGGFYHACTGYSFPQAVYFAGQIADTFPPQDMIFELIEEADNFFASERFFRLLNRMLFRAAQPDQRYKVLQRFYRLNPGLIERFYASELRWYDKLRILTGKPPVPIHLALYNFSEKAFIKRERANKKATRD